MPARTERIEETTVASIDGWKVTVGNLMAEPDAAKPGQKRGTAQIGRYDAQGQEIGLQIVGTGDTLTIAGKVWRVARVSLGACGANGFV